MCWWTTGHFACRPYSFNSQMVSESTRTYSSQNLCLVMVPVETVADCDLFCRCVTVIRWSYCWVVTGLLRCGVGLKQFKSAGSDHTTTEPNTRVCPDTPIPKCLSFPTCQQLETSDFKTWQASFQKLSKFYEMKWVAKARQIVSECFHGSCCLLLLVICINWCETLCILHQ